jgi:hypothetical protein
LYNKTTKILLEAKKTKTDLMDVSVFSQKNLVIIISVEREFNIWPIIKNNKQLKSIVKQPKYS